MSEWQPIETAPKDGTQLLLHDKQSTHYDVKWDDFEGRSVPTNYLIGWWQDGQWRLVHYDAFTYRPTHWMPLPPPPSAS